MMDEDKELPEVNDLYTRQLALDFALRLSTPTSIGTVEKSAEIVLKNAEAFYQFMNK